MKEKGSREKGGKDRILTKQIRRESSKVIGKMEETEKKEKGRRFA